MPSRASEIHQLDAAQPAALERVGRKLAGVDDGNRQMVDILNAELTDGLRLRKPPVLKRSVTGFIPVHVH